MDVVNPGERTHKQASLRVVESDAMPEDMRGQIREIVSLTSANPRKGHATTLMWTVCHEADQDRTVLILQPKRFADGELDDEKLVRWYSKFGFRTIQQEPVLMARQPIVGRVLQVVQ